MATLIFGPNNVCTHSIPYREMLTSALGAIVKKIKMETLHWKLCNQDTETLKNNLIYIKFINCFYS